MWKFIVYYAIISFHQVECPDYKPTTDQFGRTTWPTSHCLVYHQASTTDSFTREFNNRDSAFAFYNDGKKEWDKTYVDVWDDRKGTVIKEHMYLGGSSIINVKIDSAYSPIK